MAKKINLRNFLVRSVLIFVVALLPSLSVAQEFNFVVTIDASQIPDIQKSVINDMQTIIKNFLNSRNWTEDEYKPEERIKGNLVISIVSVPSQYEYKATAQVQCSRPIYGTTYESILLNYFDKEFNFELNPGQPLNYNENVFNSRLVSLLSFYANIVLAADYDSFGKLAGGKYIDKAFNIAGVAREAGEGWSQGSDPNNKAALIANLNNQQFIPYREGWYNYHRKAMDTYIKDPVAARKIIFEDIKTIQAINKVNPYSILLRSFFMAKRDELINIYKDEQDTNIKTELLTMLRELDPTNSEKYQQILKK